MGAYKPEFTGFDINFNLTDRIAIVTGAAQGIGKATALLLADKGCDLVLVDLAEKVNDVIPLIEEKGRKAIAVQADLTNDDDIMKAVDATMKEYGRIDILVNCAGVALLAPAEELSRKQWDLTIALNLTAIFRLSQECAKIMMEQGKGKIVNIASDASIVSFDEHCAYCASKCGVVGITRNMGTEFANRGVNVNCISPVVVMTEMGKTVWTGEVGAAMLAKVPVGRFAYPEEVAACVVFLASDAADMITGTNLVIDGGSTVL